MKTIIYTCPYVPAEWIAAHGLRPSRLLLDHADSGWSPARAEGVCPYLRSFISEVAANTEAGGVVLTTVCDQMRRAFDIIVRECDIQGFLMNVPNTWQNAAAQNLYIDELKRLGRFLIRLGGTSPANDALVKIMRDYDDARQSVRSMQPYLAARRYAEAIAALDRDGPNEAISNATPAKPAIDVIPLAIIGGPLIRPDLDLFDMVEQLGGRIVLDATETGERGMCLPFDRRRLADDPLTELARAYFGGIHDASRRPNSELYRWLKRELVGRAVRGIILRRYVWCDIWHAEFGRLKDWTHLPVLDMDSAGDYEMQRARTSNRIRAFLEMLQ
jgi:benzoyl-CoA reductase/2-hydroxyglutaryl-CoA dehydratase subunit BcrC/BadD/HgdB